MIRKVLCLVAVVGFASLPLTVGCEDDIKHVDEKRTTHEGPTQDVSPGQEVVE